MDKSKVRCGACKKALETDGQCEHCRIGAVAGKIYRSPVAYRLAKGQPISAELIKYCPKRCDACKKAFVESGKCEHCKVGFVAGRMYKLDKDYDAALAAHEILERSAKAATICEACAVAMVTDGTCEHCRVKFKDGQYARLDK